MLVIFEIELKHLLQIGRINISEIMKAFQKVLDYIEVLKSLMELKNVKNVHFETRLNERQVLEIGVHLINECESQPDFYFQEPLHITNLMIDAVEEFKNQHDTYTQQIFENKYKKFNPKFEQALKSIAKFDNESIECCRNHIVLPPVDATIFKNILIEPPLAGRGRAYLMKFDEKIINITPDQFLGHKFKAIEVTITKEQLHELVDLSYESQLYGNYVLTRSNNRYELVSFEVVQMTLDF